MRTFVLFAALCCLSACACTAPERETAVGTLEDLDTISSSIDALPPRSLDEED